MRDGKSGDIFTFCTRRKRSVYSIVARFSFTTKSPNPQKRLGDHRPTEPCTPHSRNNAAQHLGRAGFRNGKARARSQYTNIGKHPHEASAERCRPTKGRCPSDCVTAPTSSTCARQVNRLNTKQAPCLLLFIPASVKRCRANKIAQPQKRLGDHRPTEPCTPHIRNPYSIGRCPSDCFTASNIQHLRKTSQLQQGWEACKPQCLSRAPLIQV